MISKLRTNVFRFLRSTEKYSGTDNIYLFKGFWWLGVLQFFTGASLFLLSIIYANALSKTMYGNFKYILSLAGMLNALSLTGMNTAVTQAVAKGFDGVYRRSFLVQLKWNYLLAVVTLGGSIYYAWNDHALFAGSLLIIALTTPVWNSASTYIAFLVGKKLFKPLSLYNSSISIIMCTVLATITLMTKNVFLLVLSYFLVNTLLNMYCYAHTLRRYAANDRTNTYSLTYGKHLSVNNFISTAASYLDQVLVFHFVGPIQLAIYHFAIAVPDQLRSFLKNVPTLALPKFSARSRTHLKQGLAGKALRLLLVVVIMVLSYIIVAPVVYHVFFPQYIGSIHYSQFYALTIVLSSVSIFLTTVFQAQGDMGTLYRINTLSSLVQVISMLVLVMFFNIWGILIARLVTDTIRSLSLVIAVKRL